MAAVRELMNVGDIVPKLTGCYHTEMQYSGATVQLLRNSDNIETPMQALISTHPGPVPVELSAVAYPCEVTQRCNIMVTIGQPGTAHTVSNDDIGTHLRLRVSGVGEVGGRAGAGSAGQLLFESDVPAEEPMHRVVEVLWCLQSAQIPGTLYCDAMPVPPWQTTASSGAITEPIQKT